MSQGTTGIRAVLIAVMALLMAVLVAQTVCGQVEPVARAAESPASASAISYGSATANTASDGDECHVRRTRTASNAAPTLWPVSRYLSGRNEDLAMQLPVQGAPCSARQDGPSLLSSRQLAIELQVFRH